MDFYDKLFETIGVKRLWDMADRKRELGPSWDRPPIGVCKPRDGGAASTGNGTMIVLAVDSRAKVDALPTMALELGGADEGAPGRRRRAGDELLRRLFPRPRRHRAVRVQDGRGTGGSTID